MTIDNLKCFILVAENLSFARAAEALYISQPAVTKQINSLELELGVTLFIRSTRHVELTSAGMSFYKDAKDIVIKSQMAVSRAKKYSIISDSLRIALSNQTALFYLAPILARYHTDYPEIHTDIECSDYKTSLNLFLDNKLDILFYYKENMTKKSGIQFIELETDQLVCLLPASHPFATKKSISLKDLEDVSIIACNPLNAPLSIASFQQEMSKQHSEDKIIYCNSIEIAHCMTAANIGVSILPQLLTLKTPDFVSIPLKYKLSMSFGVFYFKRNTNVALKKFLTVLSKMQVWENPDVNNDTQ